MPEFAHSVRNAGDPRDGQDGRDGEEAIKALGFRQFRVRFHGELVRIEIAREEMEKALTLEMAEAFTNIFKPLGFNTSRSIWRATARAR